MSETFPPIIDLTSSDAPAAIDRACREVGFFQVVGHGISQTLLDDVMRVADEFFGADLEQKAAWMSDDVHIERGYSAKGTEGLAYSLGLEQPPDLFEAFSMGLEPLPDAPAFHTTEHHSFEPNIWPTEPADLRPVLLEYYRNASALAHRVTGLMAQALGLEKDFFEAYTDASADALRVNFFEGRPGDTAKPQQFGIGPHTDYGICTILFADQEPGLQVYADDEEWHYVVPAPGALVVNVGDLLSRWTNDRWRSTLHRVMPILSSDPTMVRRRRSVPYFHEGNYDALVECLPTCTDSEHPPLYPPIKGGEHVKAKLMAGKLLETTDAAQTVGDRTNALKA